MMDSQRVKSLLPGTFVMASLTNVVAYRCMPPQALDKNKYKNLILYLLERANDANLGKKKLFKLLYFIDFDYYERHGKSITGETYVVHQYGPVPMRGEALLSEMATREIVKKIKVSPPYVQHRFIPQVKADLTLFNAEELKHIEGVIERFTDCNGAEIETKAKSDIPYQATKSSGGGAIDYDLVLYRVPSSAALEDEGNTDRLNPKIKRLQKYLQGAESR